jgi:hypothetical protein
MDNSKKIIDVGPQFNSDPAIMGGLNLPKIFLPRLGNRVSCGDLDRIENLLSFYSINCLDFIYDRSSISNFVESN